MRKEKNQLVKTLDGKSIWDSRHTAVVACIVVSGDNFEGFLVAQRGPGCPDNIGNWAFPCGYLDWGESGEEAVRRELLEEINLYVSKNQISLFELDTEPANDARQNIVIRYIVKINKSDAISVIQSKENICNENRGGESNEVSDINLIQLSDITKLTWAYNHDDVINRLAKHLKLL